MPAADLIRRAVPGWLKHRHERWERDRFLRSANALNDRYAADHGLEVKRGPFAGLRYPRELLVDSGDAVAKLVGTYEEELTPVFEAWIAAGHERIVDVGASEGYYAVGLALAAPQTTVIAYDIDPVAREKCAALAQLNGVADRVELREECTHAELAALPAGTALLSDCEGCERELLDPAAAPALRSMPILVELHDFIDPSISATIRERFETTHDIELIEGRDRDGAAVPELADFAPGDRALLLSERRPARMSWASLTPKA